MVFNCYLVFKTSPPLRNYGGVYVGLPADLTTVAASQSKATRKGELQHALRTRISHI